MGLAHLQGVLTAAATHHYAYNFRFAALVLVGIVIAYAGGLCIAAVSGLSDRRAGALARAGSGALLLIVVSVPLLPLQPELAGALTFLGALTLVALFAARRKLRPG